jgi:hypothetical protein
MDHIANPGMDNYIALSIFYSHYTAKKNSLKILKGNIAEIEE